MLALLAFTADEAAKGEVREPHTDTATCKHQHASLKCDHAWCGLHISTE